MRAAGCLVSPDRPDPMGAGQRGDYTRTGEGHVRHRSASSVPLLPWPRLDHVFTRSGLGALPTHSELPSRLDGDSWVVADQPRSEPRVRVHALRRGSRDRIERTSVGNGSRCVRAVDAGLDHPAMAGTGRTGRDGTPRRPGGLRGTLHRPRHVRLPDSSQLPRHTASRPGFRPRGWIRLASRLLEALPPDPPAGSGDLGLEAPPLRDRDPPEPRVPADPSIVENTGRPGSLVRHGSLPHSRPDASL